MNLETSIGMLLEQMEKMTEVPQFDMLTEKMTMALAQG